MTDDAATGLAGQLNNGRHVYRAVAHSSGSARTILQRIIFWPKPGEGRGRDEDYSSPPAQIPACAANAPGLYEDAAVKGIFRWCLAILIALGYGFRRAVKPRSRKAVRRRRRA